MPGAISVRTRGPRATMTVACEGAEAAPHRVTVTIDGNIEFSAAHNAEHDAVMRALGAPAHPCQQASQAYKAASTIYRALIGECDSPDFYANQRHLLRSRNPCPTCPRWGSGDVAHFHSCQHQGHQHETDSNAVQTLLKWMVRNSVHRDSISARMFPIIERETLAGYRVDPYSITPAHFITEPFLAAAVSLFSEEASIYERTALVRTLRCGGVKVQWLTALVASLTPVTLRRIKRAESISAQALIGARNIAPEKVARYINAGITANFYTYARVDARPEDVLSVFRATEQRHTLAEDLREGVSIPDALARLA